MDPAASPTTAEPLSRPFRFKSQKRSRSPSLDETASRKHHKSSSSHHRRHHRHRHRHRHRHSSEAEPSLPPISPPLSPDTAFRESLFDALADDEGAAYWESVYGQPIHTYSPYLPSDQASDENNLNRMTDEEYTSYVRAKMWEKSHSYIVEERKKREEARQRSKEQEEARRKDREEWGRRVDEVLAERAQRSKKKEESQWNGVWKRYLRGWEDLKEASQKANDDEEVDHTIKDHPKKSLKTLLPYPVLSLQRSDISREAIELFIRKVPQADNAGKTSGEVDLQAVLKAERVRWHPDKIQQRFGNMGADEGTMRAVTAVFQVVDRMWGDVKEKGGQQRSQ